MHYYAIALTYIFGCALLHTSLDLKKNALVKYVEQRKSYTKNIFFLLFFEFFGLFCPPDDLLPHEISELVDTHAGLSVLLVMVFGLMLFDRYLAERDKG